LSQYSVHEEVYEYKIVNNVNIAEAWVKCNHFGMQLPEPKSARFNTELRTFWDSKGRGLFLGITDEDQEGEFRYFSNREEIEYNNFPRRGPNNGGNKGDEHFVVMLKNGMWNDVNKNVRLPSTLCIKPHVPNENTVVESVSMFQNAEWIWSSLNTNNNAMRSNEDLFIQMASSGYYQ